MLSQIKQLNKIENFPSFTGERVYMLPFKKQTGLPKKLQRWQNIIDNILQYVKSDKFIFLMIDQSFVKAGTPQRRPGLHIDGVWKPTLNTSELDSYNTNKYIYAGGHDSKHSVINTSSETILLISDILGCKAYAGTYQDIPREGGNCQHISIDHLSSIPLLPNFVWQADNLTLHESLPVKKDCYRTLLRLNVQL